ncbi:GRIP1-associated protein 1 isoform X2 [Pristis pectinata]|uniref:GRIP1-associated protein 1 isoform X2 n=1 Tax=Pristis pectinata TaxID=685728 RepID=UPI00223DEEF1|nr:GRIP1-associated protein 1 isoform X2 [Pristis pectinata]
MAQALSEEEFQRMQAQLLELRTQNYQLSDELRKQSAEVNSLRLKSTNVEKDLAKAQKAVTKSKKAQEVDALLSENEMLQGKLHSQEDDFRLQNSTLMQELSKLCAQIEELEAENKRLKEKASASDPNSAASPVDGELLRLQAENTALQRNLAALQQRYEQEVQAPRHSEEQEANGNEEAVVDRQGLDGSPKEDVMDGSEKEAQEPSKAPLEKLEQLESKCAKLEQKLKEFNEMELKWEMEREEKRLVKEQLQTLEMSKQSELSKLQEEANKLSEKLKKKQESFLRLQTEKEALYNDSRTKIDELQQRKEEELKSLNARNQRLRQEAQAASQSLSDLREHVLQLQREHEAVVQGLRDQIQTAKTQEMNQLRDQVVSLTLDIQQRQSELEVLEAERDDLSSQLQGVTQANGLLLEQAQQLECDRDQAQQDLEEARKSADKRKAMLDELAIEMQQEQSRHKEAVGSLKLQHEKDVLAVRARYERELRQLHEDKHRAEEELRAQLRDEKARGRELESLQQKVEELGRQVEAAEGAKGWLQRSLKEAEELVQQKQKEHEENVRQLQETHALELQAKERETASVREELARAEAERDEHGETIGKLRQEIKDTVDGQRILEKKGSSALKDLKRQLHLERKRADKLQERLQDVLTNTKSRTGLEDLVLAEISSPSRVQTGDSSSVSSFSYREAIKEGASSSKSNTGSPQSQRPADLSDDEISDLFQRLAEVQQEKWMLEEKVKHLEVSCSSMADDLCRKSSIIETYVMDSRIDVTTGHGPAERSGLGSVLRDLVKPGDENVREMNKKLQNMLEEQLTKNMHLQKDLEVLSQELVRLSKTPSAQEDEVGEAPERS